MDEFAKIEYKEVNLLLEVGDNNSFHPQADVIRSLAVLPDYVEGISNIDGTISVVIDLAEFLDMTIKDGTENLVFLQVQHPNGNFVLKIPLPEIITEEVKLQKLPAHDKLTMKIPSANYYAVENETFLVIVLDNFVDFLTDELSEILSDDWQNVTPDFDGLRMENPAPEQQYKRENRTAAPQLSITSEGQSENIIAFQLGEMSFLIEEKFIKDIVPDEMPITPLPNSEHWYRGVVNYHNDSMIAIDTAYFLEIEERIELIIDLICQTEKDSFVLNARNVRSLSLDGLDQVFLEDFTSIQFPYANIYRDNRDNIYFKLNVETIAQSIQSHSRPPKSWKLWKTFFSRERKEFTKVDQFLMGELQSLNALSAYIGDQQLLIPYDSIDQLTPGTEFKHYKEFRFVKHNNKWVPSIDLSKLYNVSSTHLPYGMMVKSGDRAIELRTELAMMNYQEAKLFDKDYLEHIAPTSAQAGIESLVKSRNGYGFQLDFEVLTDKILHIENSEGETLQLVEKELNALTDDVPQEDKVIENIDTGLWEQDAQIFLFIETDDEEPIQVFSTDEIDEFSYEIDETTDITPWQEATDNVEQYFYVRVNSTREQTYAIPSTSYLRAVTPDSIKETEEGNFITLDDERIPIRSFS